MLNNQYAAHIQSAFCKNACLPTHLWILSSILLNLIKCSLKPFSTMEFRASLFEDVKDQFQIRNDKNLIVPSVRFPNDHTKFRLKPTSFPSFPMLYLPISHNLIYGIILKQLPLLTTKMHPYTLNGHGTSANGQSPDLGSRWASS